MPAAQIAAPGDILRPFRPGPAHDALTPRERPTLTAMTASPHPTADASLQVRDARDSDLAAIQRIYAHYVLTATATFEEVPPTVEELRERHAAVIAAGLPYLVAEAQGMLLGYCYAATHRARPAYRYTIEDSVYIDKDSHGRGVGSALLGELIARCERGPWRQMIAVVGGSDNAGSVALHARHGFRAIGTHTAVGYKLGRWIDTVMMQRALGEGDATHP